MKAKFVYLAYADSPGDVSPTLLRVYGTQKAAKEWLDKVNGEYVAIDRFGKRIFQKIQKQTEQIWYVEKHAML